MSKQSNQRYRKEKEREEFKKAGITTRTSDPNPTKDKAAGDGTIKNQT